MLSRMSSFPANRSRNVVEIVFLIDKGVRLSFDKRIEEIYTLLNCKYYI